MKAQDLRVGNLVCWNRKGNNLSNEEVEIYNIHRSSIRAYTDIEELVEVLLNYEEIEPIPLTTEWLQRAGFEKNKIDRSTYYELSFGNSKLMWYDNRLCYGVLGVSQYEFVDVLNIKYVHQLQNLYQALTGEELTVKDA